MAARLAPENIQPMRQCLHHLVAKAPWNDAVLLEQVCESVLPAMRKQGPVVAWIVDDTGFPKKGKHSVGVTRQYCGQVGKQENCRVAPGRVAANLDRGVVLADAAYGMNTEFRDEVTKLALPYVMGVQSSITVWAPGEQPLPAKQRGKIGRPPRLLQRSTDHQPVSVKQLAMALPSTDFREITWREGTDRKLRSRFVAVRVRPAHRDNERAEPRSEEWLLIEWPRGEKEPTKYWLSTLPPATKLKALVKMAKHRWIIERDYQELKQELGLGHFEGRNWRGFHHHATLCIAAYGFLVAERNRFSPLPESGILDSLPPGRLRTSGHGDRRARLERHNPHSIATMRILLARLLLRQLPHCPFCGSPPG
jgi:SRSO17 transposase